MERNRRSQVLEALAALYDDQGEAVYRYLLGTLGSREDAEDALQTIWLELARRSSRLRDVDDLPAYLWAAARNRARSCFRSRTRKRSRVEEREDLDLLPAVENPGTDSDGLRDIVRALTGLPFKQREMAVLVGIEGLTLREAAERLGIPQGTAAGRYRTALVKLRRILGEEEGR